jgi:hypothetical protein
MVKPTFLYNDKNALNYQTAQALIELFDVCYKQGVVHAYQLDDNNAAKQFVIDNRKPSRYATLCDTDLFGMLTDGHVFTLERWRITLSMWARKTVKRKILEYYIERVTSERNYAGIAYALCMDFYLQGIYHYTLNPINDLTVFLKNKYSLLVASDNHKKRLIKNVDDWLRDIQALCIERENLEAQRTDVNKRIYKTAFDNFARVFWNCVHGRRGVLRERAREKKNEQRTKQKNKTV